MQNSAAQSDDLSAPRLEEQEGADLARVVEHLRAELAGTVRRKQIADAVATEAATFAKARARNFIPVLVERRVRQQFMESRRLPRPRRQGDHHTGTGL